MTPHKYSPMSSLLIEEPLFAICRKKRNPRANAVKWAIIFFPNDIREVTARWPLITILIRTFILHIFIFAPISRKLSVFLPFGHFLFYVLIRPITFLSFLTFPICFPPPCHFFAFLFDYCFLCGRWPKDDIESSIDLYFISSEVH